MNFYAISAFKNSTIYVIRPPIQTLYTANCVGQNLSTFAQCWVKYQQSKVFGQYDPMMGKT